MTDGGSLPVVLLGVIAFATLVMAMIQVALVAYALRLARRLEALLGRLDGELRPIVATAATAVDRASRAAGLAAAQVERADRVLGDLALRIDSTASNLQRGLLAPAREGRALLAGVQAAVAALLEPRSLPAGRRNLHDDHALFIG